MDRHGNRVRFTRLSITLVTLALLGGIGLIAAKQWWARVTSEGPNGSHSTGYSPEAGKHTTSENRPATSSSRTSAIGSTPTEDTSKGGIHGSHSSSNPHNDISQTHPSSDSATDPTSNSGLLADTNLAESNVEQLPEDALPISEQPAPGMHPLDSVLDLARSALDHHRKSHFDYTAKLTKTERINNRLLPTTVMDMKLRYRDQEPGTSIRASDLYFKFLEPRAQAGREVIYAPLKYDGKIKAHEGGFLGLITVELTPNSQLAMRGNRYPLTEAGIEKLIVKLIEKGERDRARGDCIVNRSTDNRIDGVACELIEVIHPEKTYIANGREYPHEFFKAQIWFEMTELVPIKYSSYQWPEKPDADPILEEEYTYTNLKFNTGLQDIDFDIENKAYAFP